MVTAASEDTEITLGTGKMLALFFGLVALCAVFFAMGFSLGKNSVLKTPTAEIAPAITTVAANTRTPAGKTSGSAAPADTAALKPAADKQPDGQAATGNAAQAATPDAAPAAAEAPPAAPDPAVPVLNGYYVQVAAVSRQEDAESLVDALKKKQYPALSSNTATDKLFHVQVGPYADIKEAEAMRAKLMGDGYNPILKR